MSSLIFAKVRILRYWLFFTVLATAPYVQNGVSIEWGMGGSDRWERIDRWVGRPTYQYDTYCT